MFADGFSDENGATNDDLPTTTTEVRLGGANDDRSRMTITSRFATIEAMEQILAMSAEGGMTLALGQIDDPPSR